MKADGSRKRRIKRIQRGQCAFERRPATSRQRRIVRVRASSGIDDPRRPRSNGEDAATATPIRVARSRAARNSSEDLVQETYARALAHLDQWQPGTRLDSWMFRIAQNLWIDHMRTQRTRGEVVDIEVIGDLLSCDGRVIAENRISSPGVEEGHCSIVAGSTRRHQVGLGVWHVLQGNGKDSEFARRDGHEPPGSRTGRAAKTYVGHPHNGRMSHLFNAYQSKARYGQARERN